MKSKILVLLALVVFLVGCDTQPAQTVCNKPYILVGYDCCLDQNDNSICDFLSFFQVMELRYSNLLVDYETEFGIEAVTNLMIITESKLNKMRNFESGLQSLIEELTTLDFDSVKIQKLNNCLSSMNKYSKFWTLGQENMGLLEDFTGNSLMLDSYIFTDDPANEQFTIDKLLANLRDLKQNARERNKLGIITFSDEIFEAYELYESAFKSLRDYSVYYEAGSEGAAEIAYDAYLRDTNTANEITLNESLTNNRDEMDSWFVENIMSCQET